MGLSNARINWFSDGFFPSTSSLWNSLPSSVFPASFNFSFFKRQVYHHLRDQMACFFYYPFLDILFLCLILLIAFLFLFLRDADSRKGTLCPFCIPIHQKKKEKKTQFSLRTFVLDLLMLINYSFNKQTTEPTINCKLESYKVFNRL